MAKNESAEETYAYFSTLDGNQHIASEFALSSINNLIDKFGIKSVLELGLGIGSICYSIHRHSEQNNIHIRYAGTESNAFCLEALPEYLKSYFNTVELYSNLDQIPKEKSFDLIIIDGKEDNLEQVKSLLTKHGIVLIEGDRLQQLEIIRKTFPSSNYARIISLYKNPDYGPFSSKDWCGGVQLIFTHPTFKQKVYYYYLKIATSIKYKLRTITK